MTMALAPVGLRNVESGSIYVKDQNLAGDYYVTVEMARFDEGTKFAAPLRIEVELDGDVSGAPVFDEPEASASPEAEPGAGAEIHPDSTRRVVTIRHAAIKTVRASGIRVLGRLRVAYEAKCK